MKTEKINEQELNNLELDAETLNELEQTELKGGAREHLSQNEIDSPSNFGGIGCC